MICTSVVSWKVIGPSKHFSVSAHHEDCSGRLLFCMAASTLSNRATKIASPSDVTPPVEPRYPIAPGSISRCHASLWRCNATGSLVCPSMTCMNMVGSYLADRGARDHPHARVLLGTRVVNGGRV